MGRVEGKVAIVTGATSVEPGGLNIGGATATELASEGARVVLADINVDGAERLAKILNDRHGDKTALAVGIDLRHEDQIEKLVQRTVDYFGAPDIVVNNAGIFPGDDGDVATMAIEVWDNVMAVNVRAAMLLTKHALPHLRKRGGTIINTASTHAFAGDTSLTGYGATKAALIALTKYTATQYGKEGVRCNAICPGTTTTPPALALPQEIKDVYVRHTMSPKLNGPSELGKVYLFLASDESRGINGEEIRVDGGLLAHQPFVPDMQMLGMTNAPEQ
ncbi:SDR family oxidoreductase [Rhodococcus oxybenzonivorans]|uniref:SDR family oxidoreductase n=1 Tax=Rhodococcus oxybenzonivorans TaxID=1990687 RepID=A0AAE4V3Y0_9NOCA|nr:MULTISPECIES: SDR family oxidoreductase [Rhodococcus]MDV7242710.1 SDR family oxidoreductase [Rhodococcus oxybenzonivorans]MDV7268123.1 SDR family oxidoreductase [Rhodococcus oxybenzonivorans]MDV7276143.1 SDR family oxidoreductase [Rhodococcus oxybenzonivorans]MDV7332198.1 SDR family oxidoreductase [Rhodococcus oxybenzonivorans]MDV7344403.1 SDR family oxidoreductase [Rhodococcus oxybenzonivorans]